MTYLYRALRSNPVGIWPCDTGLNDASGYGHNATVTGALTANRPLIAGGIQSYQFDGTDKMTLPIDKFMKDDVPFSLEVWYKPDVVAGNASLLARDNSGLFASGSQISFTLNRGTALTATFDRVEAGNIYHVVGVYDGADAYIYVNYVDVSSVSIPAGSAFSDTSANLRIEASGGAIFTVDSPAVYNYALSAASVKANFDMGTAYGSISNIDMYNGANVYRFDDSHANVRERFNLNFLEGGLSGSAAVINGRLVNQWDATADAYSEGYWNYSYLIEPDDVTIDGGRLSWDASDPSLQVSASLDGGTSFVTVSNGDDIFGQQSLNNGLEVIIRVYLRPGQSLQTVFSMTMCIYDSKDVFGNNEDLPASMLDPKTANLAEFDWAPNAFNNNAGVEFKGTLSGILVPADGEYGHYRAIEAVVYLPALPTSGTVLSFGTATITANASGQWVTSGLSALYINGSSVNTASPITVEAYKPMHIIAVFPDTAGGFYIGNDSSGTVGYPMRLGFLATYYNVISSSDASAIYGAWVGAAASQISDTSSIGVSEGNYPETGLAFRGYTYDWSITGAG